MGPDLLVMISALLVPWTIRTPDHTYPGLFVPRPFLRNVDHSYHGPSMNAANGPTYEESISATKYTVALGRAQKHIHNFGRPFVKRFALCYQTVVCLSVCNVGVLWPNGSTDQDETWHARRPRPWPRCVR